MHISVNAFNDADLLDGCLGSLRENCPDASIAVVDGRYESWPGAADNSTDETPDVAARHGAAYHPDGPFHREADKHRHRLDLAPDGERCLFIDADERLLKCDTSGLNTSVDHRVRIFNALMYGPRISYYPRYFDPMRMSVERVDKFVFDAPVRRTDAITIVHRADLRTDAYRTAKLERFNTEDRDSWYRDYLNGIDGLPDVAMQTCPNCGKESVTTSRITGYERADSQRNWKGKARDIDIGEQFSRIRSCTAGDRCYQEIVPVEFDEFRYLPDAVDEGFAKDVERVKLELMAAGWELAKCVPTQTFDRYLPNARRWVGENLQGETPSPPA